MGTRHDNDVNRNPPDDCSSARDLISAAADDALGRSEMAELDEHLAGCAECVAYEARVAALSRSTRLRVASVEPGFVDAVLTRSRPARLGRGGWLRPALAWCGLLLGWQSIAPLVFGELEDAPTHVARHVGASTLGLAIGLLYVAWRPHRAAGLLPFVGALFGATFAGAVFDVLGGDRSPVSELVHVVELAGTVLLWMVAGSPGWDRVTGVVTHRRRGVVTSTN